jgi:hypothetical protein
VHDDGGVPLPSEIETRTMARASAVPAPGRRSLHAAHAPGTTAPVRRGGRRAWAIGAAVAIAAGAVAIGILVAGRGSDEPPVAAAPEVEPVAAAPAPVAAAPPAAVPPAPAVGPRAEPAGVHAARQGESAAPVRAVSERPAPAPAAPPPPALVTLPVIVRSPPAAALLAASAARSAAAGGGVPAPRAALHPIAPEARPAFDQAAAVAPLAAAAVEPATTAGARGDGGVANRAPIVE